LWILDSNIDFLNIREFMLEFKDLLVTIKKINKPGK
jgi:hypothetical protein